jgi:hypothetical protein
LANVQYQDLKSLPDDIRNAVNCASKYYLMVIVVRELPGLFNKPPIVQYCAVEDVVSLITK